VSSQSSEEEDSGVLIVSLIRTVSIKCSSAPFWYCSRTISLLYLGLFVKPSLGWLLEFVSSSLVS
jgi:hypothetical protein